jgi:hypothetical protein
VMCGCGWSMQPECGRDLAAQWGALQTSLA